jgi:ribosome-binding protein aMBF1 (putative translation factor)
MGRPVAQLKRKTDTREADLGAVITELRVKKGWGYEEVAHKVGCNPGYERH